MWRLLILLGYPDLLSGYTNSNIKITVPQVLWKVVLGFDPNSKSEYPDYYFAFWMPNNSYEIQNTIDLSTTDPEGNIIVKNKPKNWQDFVISIGDLESKLNQDLENSSSPPSSTK